MTQKRPFSFADLASEPLEFSGPDGKVYSARRLDDFGTLEGAELQRIQRRLIVANHKLQGEDEKARDEAAIVLQQQLDAFVQLVAPTLPKDQIAAMSPMRKITFMEWWKEENPQLTAPKATAGAPTATAPTPPTPSPGWPRPTFRAVQKSSSRRRRG